MKEILALTLKGDFISPTVGKTEGFLLVSGKEKKYIPREDGGKKIPLILQQNHVDILICNGIGNCMAELLKLSGIRVIAGISGEKEHILSQWNSGLLKEGNNFSCTANGRTCGECPGSF